VEVVKTLPVQSKISLLACIYVFDSTWDNTTVNIYEIYKQIAYEVGIDVLTQRRVTDLLSELDQLGIIEGINVFQGRYGRKKVITKIVSKDLALETLYTDFSLKQVEDLPSNRFFVR
jgi:cell division control protein 6